MPDHDTTPAARRAQVEVLRRMRPEARLALAFEMCDQARAISESGRGVRWDGPLGDAGRRARIRLYYGIELPTPSPRRR